MPAKNPDLHGNAPDHSPVALLVIDMINDLEFEGGERLLPHAARAATRIAALKRRARASRIPVIYANDNLILTGINGDNCVLMTAIDAYVRDFELHVPADCTASIVRTHNTDALAYMRRMLHADTRAGAKLDLRRLRRSARRSRS